MAIGRGNPRSLSTSQSVRGEPAEPRTDDTPMFPGRGRLRIRPKPVNPPKTLVGVARVRWIHDTHRPHHLFVFVFDDVAMPGVEPSEVKVGPDPQNLVAVGDRGVHAAALARRGWYVDPGRNVYAVDDLVPDLVKVDRVRITTEIVDIPLFG